MAKFELAKDGGLSVIEKFEVAQPKTKLFANWGRYHLPVASNTNVRLAGGEFFTEKYNVLTSTDSSGKNPVLGAQIGNTTTYSDGSVHDRREIVDMDIRPMYQDEIAIGIQRAVSKKLSVGARYVNRMLDGTAMDDLIVDHALTAWGKANGFPKFDATGDHAYVLANPGQPIRMYWDFNENGKLDSNEQAVLTPQQLQYPSAVRKYHAVELFAERTHHIARPPAEASRIAAAAEIIRSAQRPMIVAGGGAKGFAHVGVIQILDSLGLRPDFVVGTSSGAIAGALLVNQTAFLTPEFMNWTRSGELMFMVILGGIATASGPLLGAAALLLLEDVAHHVTGATDNSRDFQDFFLNLIVYMAKEMANVA